MLILDKARTLDLMIARSEQVVVPDAYHAGWIPRRLAIYEPATPLLPAAPLPQGEPVPAGAAVPAA